MKLEPRTKPTLHLSSQLEKLGRSVRQDGLRTPLGRLNHLGSLVNRPDIYDLVSVVLLALVARRLTKVLPTQLALLPE